MHSIERRNPQILLEQALQRLLSQPKIQSRQTSLVAAIHYKTIWARSPWHRPNLQSTSDNQKNVVQSSCFRGQTKLLWIQSMKHIKHISPTSKYRHRLCSPCRDLWVPLPSNTPLESAAWVLDAMDDSRSDAASVGCWNLFESRDSKKIHHEASVAPPCEASRHGLWVAPHENAGVPWNVPLPFPVNQNLPCPYVRQAAHEPSSQSERQFGGFFLYWLDIGCADVPEEESLVIVWSHLCSPRCKHIQALDGERLLLPRRPCLLGDISIPNSLLYLDFASGLSEIETPQGSNHNTLTLSTSCEKWSTDIYSSL